MTNKRKSLKEKFRKDEPSLTEPRKQMREREKQGQNRKILGLCLKIPEKKTAKPGVVMKSSQEDELANKEIGSSGIMVDKI